MAQIEIKIIVDGVDNWDEYDSESLTGNNTLIHNLRYDLLDELDCLLDKDNLEIDIQIKD